MALCASWRRAGRTGECFLAAKSNGASRPFCEVNALRWNSSVLDLLHGVLSENHVIEDREIELDVPDLGKRCMLLNARRVEDPDNRDLLVMSTRLEDLTVKREAEALRIALRENQEMLLAEVQHRVANSLRGADCQHIAAEGARSEFGRDASASARCASPAAVGRHGATPLSVSAATMSNWPLPDIALRVSGKLDDVGDDHQSDDNGVGNGRLHQVRRRRQLRPHRDRTGGSIRSSMDFRVGEKGNIAVQYVGGRDDWRLTVSDDGVGSLQEPALLSEHVDWAPASSRRLRAACTPRSSFESHIPVRQRLSSTAPDVQGATARPSLQLVIHPVSVLRRLPQTQN